MSTTARRPVQRSGRTVSGQPFERSTMFGVALRARFPSCGMQGVLLVSSSCSVPCWQRSDPSPVSVPFAGAGANGTPLPAAKPKPKPAVRLLRGAR